MTLLYDSFGIRRVEVLVNFWPDFDNFGQGELSRLYGHLNIDDVFTSCDLRSNFGARFDGEHWVYDIDSSSITLRCSAFSTPAELKMRIRGFLEGTREFFGHRRIAFFVDEVRTYGTVPEDKGGNVGEIVRKRLMQRVKAEDMEPLPGLSGAGLRLIGDTEHYHWHAQIEPPHGGYGLLGLAVQLMYAPPPDPPTPDSDLDGIDEAVNEGYRFINENIKTFAQTLIH